MKKPTVITAIPFRVYLRGRKPKDGGEYPLKRCIVLANSFEEAVRKVKAAFPQAGSVNWVSVIDGYDRGRSPEAEDVVL